MKDWIVRFALLAAVASLSGCGRDPQPATDSTAPAAESAPDASPPAGPAHPAERTATAADRPKAGPAVPSPSEAPAVLPPPLAENEPPLDESGILPLEDDEPDEDDEDDEEDEDDEDEGDSGDATAISKTGGNRPVPGVSLTGTSETKIGAMKALSRFRSGNGTAAVPPELSGLWGETGDAGAGGADNGADDGEDPEDDSAEDPEDETFRKTVNLVTAALDDGDPSVREAAFETMTTLPDPEWQVLSLQIMSGDDDALKTRLIDFAKEGRDAFAVTLLMQGLDSDSPGIRAAAGDGLSSLFGLEFESTDAALDWWEENSSNYEFGEGGMTLVGPKDPGDGSDEADIGIAP